MKRAREVYLYRAGYEIGASLVRGFSVGLFLVFMATLQSGILIFAGGYDIIQTIRRWKFSSNRL